MKCPLFTGLSFLILPSIEPPRVQFIVKLIEANGGSMVDSLINDTVILINDTFVESHTLRKSELFHSEWSYDEELWYKLVSNEQLEFFKLSWLSECLKHQKLLDKADFRARLMEEDNGNSNSPHVDAISIETQSSAEDTEVEDQTLDFDVQTELLKSDANVMASQSVIEDTSESKSTVKPNLALTRALEQLFKKYRLQGDTYRARGYQLALQSIESHDKAITSEQEALSLPNIGPSIASKIQTILKLGSLPGLNEADKNEELLDYFMACHGVGAQTARKWVSNGITSLTEALKAYPSDFTWNVLFGWRFYEDWSVKIPREECADHLALMEKALRDVDSSARIVLTGSYRRGAATCGDIDTVLYKPGCDDIWTLSQILEKLVLRLKGMNYIRCPLNLNHALGQEFKPMIETLTHAAGFHESYVSGPKEVLKKFYFGGKLPSNTTHGLSKTEQQVPRLKFEDSLMSESDQNTHCRRVDILLSRWSQLGAVMIYFTGNDDFNKSLRIRATKRGWKLSNNGLYQSNANTEKKDLLIESFDERRIMSLLGVVWCPPEERNIKGYI
ncbi:LAME_0E11496g1_1 [Lachancea meyersii CBS 8951]|uniref:DNA polymerase n=1 Tax=Lachancea meyersii CBS 8951 TaxID=1266667 RepID=A0A1G4JL19_9SACH|nr:LAME_0E11496g1_1 [Lachancea meyersii CBS 8951]